MINQRTIQHQTQRILPQQIQLLNIFHLNHLELEQRITQEIEDNPLLEIKKESEDEGLAKEEVPDYADWDEFGYDDIPDYKLEYNNFFSSESLPEKPLVQTTDGRDILKETCRFSIKSAKVQALAEYLIDSLNEKGLLEHPLRKLAEDISFKLHEWITEEQLQDALAFVQACEPPGVGARNIPECLLLQLKRMNSQQREVSFAITIIEKMYDHLINRNFDKIMLQLKINEFDLRTVLELIGNLSLQPLKEAIQRENISIEPDFNIYLEEDSIQVTLSRQQSDDLQINYGWLDATRKTCKNDHSGKQYLQSKLQAAEWFLNAIQQREHTMLKIMNAIVDWQYDYFLSGDKMLLKPMILKNIASRVGLDISTVSRITSNKYAATPYGNILLKNLFSEGVTNTRGETVCSRIIQQSLSDIIASEDKSTPLTDLQLANILAAKGYQLARRTIAKYREELHIPASQIRAIMKN